METIILIYKDKLAKAMEESVLWQAECLKAKKELEELKKELDNKEEDNTQEDVENSKKVLEWALILQI